MHARQPPAMILLTLALSAAASSFAAERGTAAEARAMLAKAVAHYSAVGRAQALADFTHKVAPFGDRDLYVACINTDHVLVANGGFPSVVGTSADAVKSADGKLVGQAAWDAVAGTGAGAVHYLWVNPANGKSEPKTTFFQKVGSDICGVGVYQPQ